MKGNLKTQTMMMDLSSEEPLSMEVKDIKTMLVALKQILMVSNQTKQSVSHFQQCLFLSLLPGFFTFRPHPPHAPLRPQLC